MSTSFWVSQLKTDPTKLLFDQGDGFTKYILLNRFSPTTNDEFSDILKNRIAKDIFQEQDPIGSWSNSVYYDFYSGTTKQLIRLGGLGFTEEHPRVKKAVDYIFSHQLSNGAIGEDKNVYSSSMCRHHFLGNLCISLDSLRALSAVQCQRAEMEGLIQWILSWQDEEGFWTSPGAKHRENRGISGKPGCGWWLICWALMSLSLIKSDIVSNAKSKAIKFLLNQYGMSDTVAWKQTQEEFMWCSENDQFPEETMEQVVTGCILYALVLCGVGLEVPQIKNAASRLIELQGSDGFWTKINPRVDRWLSLIILATLTYLGNSNHGILMIP